jgi:hypothetical protein
VGRCADLYEFHVGEQLTAALLVLLSERSRFGLELAQVDGQHVISNQRVGMQEKEHRRRNGERENHRHPHADLGHRHGVLQEQVLVGSGERSRE